MATNLRLRPDAEDAVRREAQRTGRSQQDIIRAAVDRHLGLLRKPGPANELEGLVAAGVLRPPRSPYRKVDRRLTLPRGVTTAELLDREDRV